MIDRPDTSARTVTIAEAGAREWWIYVLRCDGRALYTGVSTDIDRRLRQHATGAGARSLRRYSNFEIVYAVPIGDRGLALQIEYRIKQMDAAGKRQLVAEQPMRADLLVLLNLAGPPSPGQQTSSAGA